MEIFDYCPFTQGALTSDNPRYVNQAWHDRTGLTLMPANVRLLEWCGVHARAGD